MSTTLTEPTTDGLRSYGRRQLGNVVSSTFTLVSPMNRTAVLVPARDRQLGSQDGGTGLVAIFADLPDFAGARCPPPSPRTSFPRPCVPGAAPCPGAAANADSARKTNCSDTPRDSLDGILPTPTAGSDGDAAAVVDGY